MFHSKVFLHSVTMVTMSYLCLVTCRRWSSWLHMVSVVMMEIFMSCQANTLDGKPGTRNPAIDGTYMGMPNATEKRSWEI